MSYSETVKIKPSHPSQGDHVLINKSDFDPDKHELFDVRAITRTDIDKALAALPGDQTDQEYVVGAMRNHYGDLFTADDEKSVRELVKAPGKKASDGLTVPEIKEALTAKDIAIPDGVTLKADLAALLDAS